MQQSIFDMQIRSEILRSYAIPTYWKCGSHIRLLVSQNQLTF
jgi:hypothetical protein